MEQTCFGGHKRITLKNAKSRAAYQRGEMTLHFPTASIAGVKLFRHDDNTAELALVSHRYYRNLSVLLYGIHSIQSGDIFSDMNTERQSVSRTTWSPDETFLILPVRRDKCLSKSQLPLLSFLLT